MGLPGKTRLFRLGDLLPRSPRGSGGAPGQRAIDSYPRYGTHFARRDPPIPERPLIEIAGVELDATALEKLPRTDLVADFHCVAGWTARGLHWEGVRFRDIYETLGAKADITHIRAVGRDGFRSVILLEDALADDVLIADRLDGAPLPLEHGGPFRLLSAGQYGYKSVKHLCRVELHAGRPSDGHARLLNRLSLKPVAPHPRARVEYEERHRTLPSWVLRDLYIWGIHPVAYALGYLGASHSARLPDAVHESRPWRIHEIVSDFVLEDVWELPAEGGAEDFQELLDLVVSLDPTSPDSRAARALWELRDRMGGWFDLGRISAAGESAGKELPIPDTNETSLADRLPADLRGTAADVDFGSLPFEPLYRTDREFAAEVSNRTVHGVLHLAWADRGEGRYQAEMAVYVKPRGALGEGYMALIKPFRHAIVYPALMRQIERAWSRRCPHGPQAGRCAAG